MKGSSEKFVSNGSWDAAAMMRNSLDDIRGLSIAAFKASQPPRPNQSSNFSSCQAIITHHKNKAGTPTLIGSIPRMTAHKSEKACLEKNPICHP